MASNYSFWDGVFYRALPAMIHQFRWWTGGKQYRDKVGHENWPMSAADKERHGLKKPDEKKPRAA